jgi:hypothetical protein
MRVAAVGDYRDATNDWPKSTGQPLSTQWSTSCGVLWVAGSSNESTLFRGVWRCCGPLLVSSSS